jgi:hypothetical protein
MGWTLNRVVITVSAVWSLDEIFRTSRFSVLPCTIIRQEACKSSMVAIVWETCRREIHCGMIKKIPLNHVAPDFVIVNE